MLRRCSSAATHFDLVMPYTLSPLQSAPAWDEHTRAADLSEIFHHALSLPLRQHWCEREHAALAPGVVSLGWRAEGLWLHAVLDDRDIFNHARTHHTLSHETGDVFELFLAQADSTRYLELHVTPDNYHLQLKWPDHDAIKAVRGGAVPIAHYQCREPLFNHRVWIEKERWRVLALIPAATLTGGDQLRGGEQLRCAFARYDASRDGGEPVCSATAPFTRFDFHRPAEWPLFELGAAD